MFSLPASRLWRLCILAVATLSIAATQVAPVTAAPLEPLEISTRNGVQFFSVEIARTPEEKATGLMYRKELPDGRGMLFDFGNERTIEMWMKNTFISLDMIFISADGRVTHIAENTEPHSLKIVSSRGPALAVLEVIAGTAKRYGIARGDLIGHSIFKRK